MDMRENSMKKLTAISIIFILILLTLFAVAFSIVLPRVVKTDSVNFKISTEIDALHNGDAKFYKDCIITNVGGVLKVYDKDGKNRKTYHDVAVNWLDCLDEEGIIVYGNGNNELGIAKLDDDYNLISNDVIMKTENLQIDPTITKVGKKYYITATEIEGTINNPDPEQENGTYTIHLYQSSNLKEWSLVSDIVSAQNNLEDVDVFYKDGHFYVTYEKETVDKGDSAIELAVSEDKDGKKFSEPKQLLESDCDHEPAAVFAYKNGCRLYYSCDKNDRGQSYQGAQAFYADYDTSWNLKKKDQLLHTETKKGILLYDVDKHPQTTKLLYTRNYLTDSDCIVEKAR